MKLTKSFVNDIRNLVQTARATIARGVDLVQVHTNFEIGRRIVEQEQKGKLRAAYGKEIVKALSQRLAEEFGSGFSKSNVEYMSRFYLLFADRLAITQTVSGQLARRSQKPQRPFTLSWSHYVFLVGIDNADERSFYEIESASQDWTVRELKRQYNSSLYERLALSRDKKGIRKLAKQGQQIVSPEDLLKEPLVLEFLGLEESAHYSESDLETAIINQIERFLLEMGKGFLFAARQRRFTFDSDHYFVDLVFYNRLLHCYVLIDLKLGKLTHQDLGQMQMYVNYYDANEKSGEESATVGIILCKQKNKAMVRITLPKNANIHAREYQLYLPSKEELQRKLVQWSRS